MRWWTSEDLAELYERLSLAGVEFVVIGGQAVNLWSQHYQSIGEVAPTDWAALQPFASRDLDLLGGRLEASAAAEALHIEAVLFEPGPRNVAPNAATLYVPLQGDELVVQFLHTPFGARREEIRATARTIPLGDSALSVMHPVLCLESKIECLFGLNQAGRQDLKHIRLSALCVRELLRESVQREGARQLLTSLERLAGVASEEHGIRLHLEHGISLEDIIPWTPVRAAIGSSPKIAAFLDRRWPQLEARIKSRRERYAERIHAPRRRE
jgi:hypothetical protein